MAQEQSCHYCQTHMTVRPLTRDHIVPRYRVRSLRLPSNHPFFGVNTVRSCQPCNSKKGGKPPSCPCERCRYAWAQFLLLKIGIDPLARVS